MSIKDIKTKDERFYKKNFPIADYDMEKKSEAQLNKGMYQAHNNFLKYLFAITSFLLYAPTLAQLYIEANFSIAYMRLILVALFLLMIEIGLSYSLYVYFKRKWDLNDDPKPWVIIFLSILSIMFSSLSGVNTIDIVDKSERTILAEQRLHIKEDIDKYEQDIIRNDKNISDGNRIIINNNNLINGLAPIAATKNGSAQIAKYQEQNNNVNKRIDLFVKANAKLHLSINDIRRSTNVLTTDRLTKASNKELVYMIIFFFAGVFVVLALVYSYNFIGKYKRALADAKDIDVINDIKEEKEEALENKEKEREDVRLKAEEKRIDTELRIQEKKSYLDSNVGEGRYEKKNDQQ